MPLTLTELLLELNAGVFYSSFSHMSQLQVTVWGRGGATEYSKLRRDGKCKQMGFLPYASAGTTRHLKEETKMGVDSASSTCFSSECECNVNRERKL